MLTPRPDLDAALTRAVGARSDVPPTWLDVPPAGTHTVFRSVRLGGSADLRACGAALLSWDLHRLSGLRVVSDGVAAPGTTVVLALRLGPLWATAPCRVLAAFDDDRVGFGYVTLPGHPEQGIEEFAFVRDPEGLRFEIRAVSRSASWSSRTLPFAARRVQADQTQRYLDAAESIAARTLGG